MELFRADPRVLAAYLSGSVGTEREDEHADVDPVLLVRAEQFDAFDRELPGLFARLGVEPVLWWPERVNCEVLKNYAVLFERDGELLQYDLTISAAAAAAKAPVTPSQVIFDKVGALQVVEPSPEPAYPPERLRWTIEMYWLYVYIHAKYLKRRDRFKLIAAQHELLHCHLEVLRALHPDVPRDWWPITAKRVCSGDSEAACVSYLGSLDAAAVSEALAGQMAHFAEDARAACDQWGVEYPTDFEARARKHVMAAVAGEIARVTRSE
jgi:hypothetical protein